MSKIRRTFTPEERLSFVLEETDETLFWLDFLIRLRILDATETSKLVEELDQLIRLFATIKKRMKEKIEMAGREK